MYSLSVDGGSAEIMDDGTVEATPPSIVLTAEPTVCNLPYRSAASLEVRLLCVSVLNSASCGIVTFVLYDAAGNCCH